MKLPIEGVIIHSVDTSRSEPAHVIDIDVNRNTGDDGAVWKVGETFTDAANAISVHIDGATTTGYVVTVRLGGAPQPSATPTATPTRTTSPTPANTPTNTTTPSLTATPTPYVQRVNAGGPAYSDAAGNRWDADRAFVDGSFGYFNGGSAGSTSKTISNSGDPALYQTYHSWPGSAQPGYKFTLPNGWYEVMLRFAETENAQAGQRVFDVKVAGATVLPAFDIAAEGGADSAVDHAYTVQVTDGILRLAFAQITGEPKINGIQILAAVGNGQPTPTNTATRTNTPTPTSTALPTSTSTPAPTYTNTPSSTPTNQIPSGPTLTPTRIQTPTSMPSNTATPTTAATYLRRVNVGGTGLHR